MVLCDLPYGTTACKWDTIIPFEPLWKEYKRIIKDNGAIVLTASQPFTSALVMSNPDMFKYEWIWEKATGSNFATVKYMPMKEHENILVFGKGVPVYYPQLFEKPSSRPPQKGVTSDDQVYGDFKEGIFREIPDELGYPRSVIEFSTAYHAREAGLHPTQKPIALLQYLIKTYTNENEVVLDNCMGSGTTGVACINTGRRFIGMEKEEKYFVIASKRIADALNAVSN